MLKDPVCRMGIDVRSALQESYRNATYHFCSEECVQDFKARPEDFANV